MQRFTLIRLLADLLLGLGFVFIISPLALYFFIHGNYERYVWIIKGPYPFSHFGGGPFQLFMYISLFIIGSILITISMILLRRRKNR